MSELVKNLSDEIEALISEGELLSMAMENDWVPDKFREAYLQKFSGDVKVFEKFIKKLPKFSNQYQSWYSKAQAVIKQVLPDRLSDFISYFEPSKGRKNITFQNYMIRDYLQGLRVTAWDGEVVVDGSAAIPEFRQQLNMLKAAKEALQSKLVDMQSVIQADLFDSEVEAAEALWKAGHLRASGAICGVVIEKHLLKICEAHNINVRKKNPAISDLNQLLRNSDVTTVPQWRFIQHLADIRNICGHAKGREPSKEEVEDLVTGARKVIKTIF